MKPYVHARLSQDERALLERLKHSTGHSESELLRRGLHLVSQELRARPTALDVAGPSVGKFKTGPRDLSTHPKHLEGFGA
jgi:hypothetical protein